MNDPRETIKNFPLLKALVQELNEDEKKQLEEFTEILLSKMESRLYQSDEKNDRK